MWSLIPQSLLVNRKHQLIVYAGDVSLLGENLQTVRENTEIFIKKQGHRLRSKIRKSKYMVKSRQQDAAQNQNIIIIWNLLFENLDKFK